MPTKSLIPLVRLNLLLPFVQELDRREVDANAVLAASGLFRGMLLDKSIFSPPVVVHRFLEDAAKAANDPYFGVCVGESLDWSGWMSILKPAERSRNLAGFLIRFIRAVGGEASSARHKLEIGSEYASFREIRTTDQEIVPAQNDAFTAAYTMRILKKATGNLWNPSLVRLTVSETNALPKRYLGVHILGGDRMGIRVRFPSAWLMEQFDQKGFMQTDQDEMGQQDMPSQFLDVIRHVTFQHLRTTELSLDSVAKLVSISPQSLQRRLRANGTTLSTVIRELKKERAIDALQRTDRNIGEIATALNFSSPSSFTRAFKTWTGVTPREYRNRNRDMPSQSTGFSS